MDFTQSVRHLYALLEAGNPVEAMELYYHDEVVMQENGEKPRLGKAFCLQYEKGLMAQVQDFEAKVLAQAINEATETVFTEMEISFTQTGQRHLIREVSRQNGRTARCWRSGFITRRWRFWGENRVHPSAFFLIKTVEGRPNCFLIVTKVLAIEKCISRQESGIG